MSNNNSASQNFYSIYHLRFEGLDGSKDFFTEIRRNYFEKGLSAKGTESYLDQGLRAKVRYDLAADSPMVWKRKLGFSTLEVSSATSDGYVIIKNSAQKLIVKKAYYTNQHIWIKTEFFSKTMQNKPKIIVSPTEEEDMLLVQEFDNISGTYTKLYVFGCDFSGNTIIEKKLNALTGFIPEIVANTASGRRCYLPQEQAEKRRGFLARLTSNIGEPESEEEPISDTVPSYVPLPTSTPEVQELKEDEDNDTLEPIQESSFFTDEDVFESISPSVEDKLIDDEDDEINIDNSSWDSTEFDGMVKEQMGKIDDFSLSLFNQYGFDAPSITEDYYQPEEEDNTVEAEQPEVSGKVRVAVQRINKKPEDSVENLPEPQFEYPVEEEPSETYPETQDEIVQSIQDCPYSLEEQSEVTPEPEEIDYLERLLETLAGDELITEPETDYLPSAVEDEPEDENMTLNTDIYEDDFEELSEESMDHGEDDCTSKPPDEPIVDGDCQIKSGFGTSKTSQNTFFTGNWIDGRREGVGSEFNQDGTLIYSGSWKNDAREGDGIEFGTDGGIIYFGSWKNGKYDGQGKALQKDGGYIEGEFTDGKPSGFAVQYASDGFRFFEGNWENGEYNGFGKCYLRTGGWYEGIFMDGKPSGILNGYNCFPSGLQITFPEKTANVLSEGTPTISIPEIPAGKNQLIYTGEWANHSFNGNGVLFSETGEKIYEGQFKDNSFGGTGCLFSENGEYVYCGQFKDGKRNGIGSGYRAGKLRYYGQWKDDYWEGNGVEYSDGEPAYVGFFEKNLKHGRVNIISDDTIKYECIYDNGVLSYIRCYAEGRKIFYEGSVKNAVPCGMGCLINDFGEKLQEGVFNGKVLEKAMPVNLRSLPRLPYVEELVNSDYEKFRVWGSFVMDMPYNGGCYSGGTQDSLPNGKGTVLYSDHRFTGHFSSSHPSGDGILYTNGGIRYTGEFLPVFKPNSKVLTFMDGQVYYYYPSDNLPFQDPEGILTGDADFSDMNDLARGEDEPKARRIQIKRKHTLQLDENLSFEDPEEAEE